MPHLCPPSRFSRSLVPKAKQCLCLVALALLCVLPPHSRADSWKEKEDSVEDRFLKACFASDAAGSLDVIKDILLTSSKNNKNLNINVQDPISGQTCLMGAVLRGKYDLVRYLMLETSANVTLAERDGYTLAHGAGFQGRPDIMTFLHQQQQQRGINVLDDFHRDGFAPLHRACWGSSPRHAETVRVLLDELGADVNLKSKSGHTCLDMSRNEETRALLKERGGVETDEGKEEEL